MQCVSNITYSSRGLRLIAYLVLNQIGQGTGTWGVEAALRSWRAGRKVSKGVLDYHLIWGISAATDLETQPFPLPIAISHLVPVLKICIRGTSHVRFPMQTCQCSNLLRFVHSHKVSFVLAYSHSVQIAIAEYATVSTDRRRWRTWSMSANPGKQSHLSCAGAANESVSSSGTLLGMEIQTSWLLTISILRRSLDT